jgi:hypothetical protein
MDAHSEKNKRLKTLLREVFILRPAFSKGEAADRIDELFQDICNLIFSDDYFLQGTCPPKIVPFPIRV